MSNAAAFLAELPPERMVLALELIDYMLGEALRAGDADIVLTNMSERIFDAGVPLDRATSIVQLLHAESVAGARYWERAKARGFLHFLMGRIPTTFTATRPLPRLINPARGWCCDCPKHTMINSTLSKS